MASATIFKNLHIPIENRSLILITKDMQGDKYMDDILKIRALVLEGKMEEADELKKKLPAFTPSGTFEGGIKPDCLIQYSSIIVLDYDNLTAEQLVAVFAVAKALPYTFSCFLSPKGNGVKILVEVTSSKEYHKQAYNQIADFYEKNTGLPIDRSGSNINRLCFVSYDPNIYRNINAEKFPVLIDGIANVPQAKVEPVRKPISPPVENITNELKLDMQVNFTNAKVQFVEGSRNNYVYVFACNCNRAGIPELETLNYCLRWLNYNEAEVTSTVKSAYKNNAVEFAKFTNLASPAKPVRNGQGNAGVRPNTQIADNVSPEQEDYLKNTPIIPVELYRQMPDLIKDGARVFKEERERDVYLTGALAILSGCMPGVKGIYGGQEVFPNLFSFIIAPAASGKGVLKFAKMLADEYHSATLKASRDADKAYNDEAAAHKQQTHSGKKEGGFFEELPIKPPFKILYLPGNTSHAKILWHLDQNSGSGIICETEADTIGSVFKQDWGSYSHLMRNAFQHEKVSSSKKNNNEFIEVDTPKLSMALSGTPNQVTGLIASPEDGLFSRFLFYVYKAAQVWKDVSPKGTGGNLTEHFRTLSKRVYEMTLFLEKCETEITLSDEQWAILNQTCAGWLGDVVTFTSEEAGSVVKRLGLIMYRMAMIFTALRKFENGDMTEKVQCTDVDFNVAVRLSEIYMQHSILMFNNLPKQEGGPKFEKNDYKLRFFESLPAKFTRAEAIALGVKYKMSARTVDDLLRNAINHKFLIRPEKIGFYQKV